MTLGTFIVWGLYILAAVTLLAFAAAALVLVKGVLAIRRGDTPRTP